MSCKSNLFVVSRVAVGPCITHFHQLQLHRTRLAVVVVVFLLHKIFTLACCIVKIYVQNATQSIISETRMRMKWMNKKSDDDEEDEENIYNINDTPPPANELLTGKTS